MNETPTIDQLGHTHTHTLFLQKGLFGIHRVKFETIDDARLQHADLELATARGSVYHNCETYHSFELSSSSFFS